MIIGTVTSGLAITSPIAMGIIMTGAKVSIVTTISILPPDEAIDAFTAGSTATVMIFTMTDLIPTMAAAIAGGTEAGTMEDIVMMGGMATGTGMVIGMDIIDRNVGIIHSDNTRAILTISFSGENFVSLEKPCGRSLWNKE
jgi:hypothetical protein